jgi:hypothetical protein
LLTFWPPAPDDLEKLVFEMDTGIVILLRSENHLRAASRSASSVEDRDEYVRQFCANANCRERGLKRRDLRA